MSVGFSPLGVSNIHIKNLEVKKMMTKNFKVSVSLSGNYNFHLTIDGDRFYKGSIRVHDNTMGNTVLKISCVDVGDVLECFYWLNNNQYNSFNAYGGSKIAIVEFGEFVDSRCKSIKILDSIIEYLNNNTYGGFDYGDYSESVALEEMERGIRDCENWRERDL